MKHDSNFLQILIKKVFKNFNIGKDNIISIAADNASNMIKIIENSMKVGKKGKMIILLWQMKLTKHRQKKNLDDVIEEASKLCKIRLMWCAVHTLQFAIRNGLKDYNVADLIDKLREVAVATRMPNINVIVKRSGNGVILDQATQWGSTMELNRSTYLMIQKS